MKKKIRYPFEIEGKKYIPIADFSRQIGVPYSITQRAVEVAQVKLYDMEGKNYELLEEAVGMKNAIKYIGGVFLGEDSEQAITTAIERYKSAMEKKRFNIRVDAKRLHKMVRSYLGDKRELDEEVTRKLEASLEILEYLMKI